MKKDPVFFLSWPVNLEPKISIEEPVERVIADVIPAVVMSVGKREKIVLDFDVFKSLDELISI